VEARDAAKHPNILKFITAQPPQQRIIWLKMEIVPLLRNPAFNFK